MKKIFLAAALTASFFGRASAETHLRQLTALHQRLNMRFQDSPPLPARKEILKKEHLWGGFELVTTKEYLGRVEIPYREEILPYDPNRKDWYSQYPDREYLFEGQDRVRVRYYAKTVDKFRTVKPDRSLAGWDLSLISVGFGVMGGVLGAGLGAFAASEPTFAGGTVQKPNLWVFGGFAGVAIVAGIFLGYYLASQRIREGVHSQTNEEQAIVGYHK